MYFRKGSPGAITKAENELTARTLVDMLVAKEMQRETETLIGKSVEHETFGFGTIEAIIGAGDSAKLRIAFDKVGVKTLVQSLASSKLKYI